MSSKTVVNGRATFAHGATRPTTWSINACLPFFGVYAFNGSIGKVPQVKLDRMVERRGMHWWQSETVGGRE